MKYKYNRISAKFWTDEKVLKWSNQTRLLAIYLLTCPHKTTEGLFRLPKQYICADLGWSLKELEKPFQELLKDDFIKYDEKVSVILLTKALKYQSPDNPNQEKAAIKKLEELPDTVLLNDFILQAKEYNQRFYQRLVKHFGEPQTPAPTLTLSPTPENNPCPDTAEENTAYSESSPAYKAALYLREKILSNNPRARVPNKDPADHNMQKWCQEMDRLHRLGPVGAVAAENKGYSWQEIKEIINWCQEDDFWKSNILSAATLRKQITKLENRMQQEKKGSRQKLSILKELYGDASQKEGPL